MKILISGGHLTPAIGFIEYIQENNKSDQIIFIGRLYNKKNKKQISQEKEEITNRGITFIPYNSVKLSYNNFLSKLVVIPSLLVNIIQAVIIVTKEKPSVFVSFGGYLAVPITIACWIMRVPIVTHEQTRTVGVANNIIAKFANKIAVSYKESLEFFPKSKTQITGNLIRKSILKINKVQPKWVKKKPTKPILYITGGSQGSEIINRTVSQVLKQLLKNWYVIHQCGKPNGSRNYKKELLLIKNKLSKANQESYQIREWVNTDELSWIYTHAKGIVSRSGANTTEEIAIKGIPSVLIPLPFSHNDEQHKNAQALSNQKQAILLEQKNLNPEVLLETVQLIQKFNRKFTRNLKLFSRTINPEEKLYQIVKSTVDKK